MKIIRAIVSGIIIWVLIFAVFTVMSFIPVIKDSELQQNMLLWIILIPITLLGVKFYYKKGFKTNGLLIGVIIVVTSLILDALITLPYVIIPNNGNYYDFYTSPFLLITVIEIIIVTFFYWKSKVK